MIGITEQISLHVQVGLDELKTLVSDLSTAWKIELMVFLHQELGAESPFEPKEPEQFSEGGFQKRSVPVQELEGICKDEQEEFDEEELIRQLDKMD